MKREERVENPAHYGGANNPYEVIKVIEVLGFNFHLGNCFKYIARAGKKKGPPWRILKRRVGIWTGK